MLPAERRIKFSRSGEMAIKRDMDPDWAEDFLRMIMSSCAAPANRPASFQAPPLPPKPVLIIGGGGGGIGVQYSNLFSASGHQVRILDKNDMHRAEDLFRAVDLVIVCGAPST